MAGSKRRHVVLAAVLVVSALVVMTHSATGTNPGDGDSRMSSEMVTLCVAIVDLGLVLSLLGSAGPQLRTPLKSPRSFFCGVIARDGCVRRLVTTLAVLQVFRL